MRSRRSPCRRAPTCWCRAGPSARVGPPIWPPTRQCAISFSAAKLRLWLEDLLSPARGRGGERNLKREALQAKALEGRNGGHHMNIRIGRRTALASSLAAIASPAVLRAQSDPIRLATLTPLTGAGGSYGPSMAKVAASVVEEVNKAGGALGRRVVLVSEDDQTNPEAAVRAARKLIDVDKVAAIMGTWASSVTTAVAPLCWESKTVLCTTSGADSITQLPHQGYIFRTQPNTTLQGKKFGEFCVAQGAKR